MGSPCLGRFACPQAVDDLSQTAVRVGNVSLSSSPAVSPDVSTSELLLSDPFGSQLPQMGNNAGVLVALSGLTPPSIGSEPALSGIVGAFTAGSLPATLTFSLPSQVTLLPSKTFG